MKTTRYTSPTVAVAMSHSQTFDRRKGDSPSAFG